MPETSDAIAIVGMAAVFPGAPDLAAFWRNIEAGVDAITDVPASRWDPVYFDPSASSPDRFYCRRGGFVDVAFDPITFGIMPVAAAGAEPDQLLALQTASRALGDAGCTVPRDRTGVILGRGGYLTPGMARLVDRVRTAQQLVTTIAELVPDIDAATLDKIRAGFQAKADAASGDAAIGLVPNLAASRIANRLDLRGPAYTVDAACASSLIAVDHGCRELATGRCDLIVAGGVHVCHDVTFWSVFTQLGALSRAGMIRPFDRHADGILIGEGAGVVVLKRLADAERDGDRIYAVIRGAGVSSDGRESSPMRPRLDGQLAALDRAWKAAGCDPATVGLVEAHGTGTPTGDEVELRALGEFFGTGARAHLGSVKSMIGHAMPAAGAAGLIKTALAIHHGVIPPSLHCIEPHPELAKTRFSIASTTEPWDAPMRRAGVSAFGFGGINAHLVVESHGVSRKRAAASLALPDTLTIAGDTVDDLRAHLAARKSGGAGRVRLAMLDPTPERIAMATKVLDRGKPWRGNHDIWFSPEAAPGRVCFVFPGIEAAFAPDVDDLCRWLGVPVPAAIAGASSSAATVRELEQRGLAVFALGKLVVAALAKLGVVPDVMAGHSLGEWTGMVASEMIPPAHAESFVAGLRTDTLEVPDVVFAAVGCSAAGAEAALDGPTGRLDAIAISHDNCPHQSVMCGKRDSIRTAIERLGARGVLCQELPFKSGFHSPLFETYLAPHRQRLATLALHKPRVPLWSATTCAPYPDDPAAVRALAIDHLVKPVRFRELVDALYSSGVRTFIQIGVGNVSGFIGDTLRGKDHTAIAAASDKPGLAQLARVGCALWADGVPLSTQPAAEPQRKAMVLDLGAPLVKLAGSVPPLPRSHGFPDAIDHPVIAELVQTFREAVDASQAVVDAWRAAQAPKNRVIRRRMSVDEVPALIDHCFYRQPAGWPTVSDRYPVVPMTMTIAMMIDAAVTHAPHRVAVALEDVRAYRWLAVAPAVEIEIKSSITGDRVDVEIPGYSRATVVLADRYPVPRSPALAPLANPRATPITADRMYIDRWMFHGPAYQGVSQMGPLGDDGVDGTIDVLPAPGALLDCAGQLMGWWVMNHETADRLAMPVRLERVELFGPEPTSGERIACRVRIRELREREVRADLELVRDGRVWCAITGWEDRRFDSDDPVWAILMYPEKHALAESRDGYVLVTEHWRAAASRELMMRRYLSERERTEFEALDMRRRRGWLLGRIAIKDAVRQHLWARGRGPMFPVEIGVDNAPTGRAIVTGADLRVSVSHKDALAVAIVGDNDVGIDIERIEARPDSFTAIAFTPAELALGDGSDAWKTRLWAAKEAVGKLRGTGLDNPRAVEVRAVADDCLIIEDIVVDTRRDGDYIVAWTTGRMLS
jgi:acyl transferase domain-containing protein/phosphopantetheinyl transferase